MKSKTMINWQTTFLCTICFALLGTRMCLTHSLKFTFMLWNLLLAFIPYLISLRIQAKERKLFINIIFLGTWLLFFPNAPYLVTDFVHLNTSSTGIIWFDVVMFFMFSCTGMYIAIKSLDNIHNWLIENTSKGLALITIIFSIIISGFGIYLGRIERWNSWNIINQPIDLLNNSIHLLHKQDVWEFTLAYSTLIGVLYMLYRIENQKMLKLKQQAG